MKTNGGFLVTKIKQLGDRIFEKILSEKNIDAFNGAQGRILYVLWQEDGISIRSLSVKCGLAITSLTTMLERMENQGLISRVQSETDKRKTLLFLTEKAHALKGEYDSVSDEMGSIYYKGFSEEEITRFEECLDRIRISHYDVRRAGSVSFEKIPVDASSKMPDDYMDSIEPYDYAELKPFSTAYLPGFLADKYDVSVEDSRERADKRCAGSLVDALENTVSGYSSCNETGRDIHLKRGKVHYALLPVWILNTRWEGKDFLFAMNGQTGKLVGKLPVSTKRVVGLFAAIAALLIAISVTALLLLAR